MTVYSLHGTNIYIQLVDSFSYFLSVQTNYIHILLPNTRAYYITCTSIQICASHWRGEYSIHDSL